MDFGCVTNNVQVPFLMPVPDFSGIGQLQRDCRLFFFFEIYYGSYVPSKNCSDVKRPPMLRFLLCQASVFICQFYFFLLQLFLPAAD